MKDKRSSSAHLDVINLVLRYDLIEERSRTWRQKNGFSNHKSQMNNLKLRFFFYYGDELDPVFTESVYTVEQYNKSMRRKIRYLLIKYPNLKCATQNLTCCGVSHDNLRINTERRRVACCACGNIFKLSEKEITYIFDLGGSTPRLKRLREPAVFIWRSI